MQIAKRDMYVVDMASTNGHTHTATGGQRHPKAREQMITSSLDDLMHNAVPYELSAARDRIGRIFQDLECRVSITTDTWTSPNRKAIMGETAHCIDSD
ncbi:hypothetical protein PsorP6_015296 [Peronosclerospora sorghi]|uniref:Uncharacterized protein n=1 Tax=Peronosclerospora sorghi TaxID=230839 RepID=A0ACC0VSP8_9STRA|nr:hypothetical protein PsorP6_015296 [Peronosclerospora sorghi]